MFLTFNKSVVESDHINTHFTKKYFMRFAKISLKKSESITFFTLHKTILDNISGALKNQEL